MGRVSVIKNFLFDQSLTAEKRKERLKLAYFIWEEVDSLMFDIRKKTIKMFSQKIEESKEFSSYQIKDVCSKIGGRIFCIFRPEWCVRNEDPILCYAIMAGGNEYMRLSVGIKKYRPGVPFKGNWKRDFCCLPQEVFKTLCDLDKTLRLSDSWKDVPELSDWWSQRWITLDADEYGEWIFWIPFPPKYRMNFKMFYLEVIEKGYDTVSDYYLAVMVSLKNATESHIDRLIEIYKNKEA
jgi:uncharacterized protein YqcC (DUF446 family)